MGIIIKIYKFIFVLAWVLFYFNSTRAQNISIRGEVKDSIENINLSRATIMLLKSKDSTLYKFARSNKNGSFAISNIVSDSYILIFSYPNYADYVEILDILPKDTLYYMNNIYLIKKSLLLENVIVKGGLSLIRIKGDTTEYDAAAYKLNKGATVEDLLKKLPGIRVDKAGNIYAQGEYVQKVLVDGEEFFGVDQTLVTHNISSDMVSKVQVYNKKSEQAVFTGIDDGIKEKTINLKLKSSQKNKYFGKIELGGGIPNIYNNQIIANAFKNQRKISFYSTLSNTGTVDLGSDQKQDLGINNNNIFTSDQGILFKSTDGEDGLTSWNGVYSGMGIPKALSSGIHYDNKWYDDAIKINANYNFGKYGITGENNRYSTFFLPQGNLSSIIKNSFDKHIQKNSLSNNLNINFSEKTSLNINIAGYSDLKRNTSLIASESLLSGIKVNSLTKSLSEKESNNNLYTKALLKRKMKKEGRTISMAFDWNTTNYTNSTLRNTEILYNLTGRDSAVRLDYTTSQKSKNQQLAGNIVYTEPVSKTTILSLKYYTLLNNTSSDKRAKNNSINNVIDTLNSNEYEVAQLVNLAGLALNYKKNKTLFQIGFDGGWNQLNQKERIRNFSSNKTFGILNPKLTFTYAFSSYKNLTINYNGITKLPEIHQLQPLYNNDDPINIYIGNTNLRPSFGNGITTMFTNYKETKKQNFVSFIGANFINNPIIENKETNLAGVTQYRYENLPTATTYNLYINGIFKKYYTAPMSFELEGSIKTNKYINIINKQLNNTLLTNYLLKATLNFWEDSSKYDITVSYSPQLYYLKSTNPKFYNSFWSNNIFANVRWIPYNNLIVETDLDYLYNYSPNFAKKKYNRLLINGSITKSFLKDQSLSIKLLVNDIFNQNKGFEQMAQNNLMIQDYYSVVKRFFLLSIIWKFNQNINEN